MAAQPLTRTQHEEIIFAKTGKPVHSSKPTKLGRTIDFPKVERPTPVGYRQAEGPGLPEDGVFKPGKRLRQRVLRRVWRATAYLSEYMTDGQLRRHVHRAVNAHKNTVLHERRNGGRMASRRARYTKRRARR